MCVLALDVYHEASHVLFPPLEFSRGVYPRKYPLPTYPAQRRFQRSTPQWWGVQDSGVISLGSAGYREAAASASTVVTKRMPLFAAT